LNPKAKFYGTEGDDITETKILLPFFEQFAWVGVSNKRPYRNMFVRGLVLAAAKGNETEQFRLRGDFDTITDCEDYGQLLSILSRDDCTHSPAEFPTKREEMVDLQDEPICGKAVGDEEMHK
jgi:hypothetical protein